jgi:hypothetical protein
MLRKLTFWLQSQSSGQPEHFFFPPPESSQHRLRETPTYRYDRHWLGAEGYESSAGALGCL